MDTKATTTREETATARAPREQLPRSTLPRRESLSRAGLNLLLVGMAVLPVAYCAVFTLDLLREPYTGYDFSVYYGAGLLLRGNPHVNIFDLHLLQAAAQAHNARVPATAYTYPPLLAILMLPLTLFPYRVALGIWTLLNLAVWLLCAALLAYWFRRMLVFGAERSNREHDRGAEVSAGRSLLPGMPAPRLFAVAIGVFLTLSYQPIEQTLVLGQVSLVILFLLMLVPLLVERDQPYLAGGVLALAIWIKLFPVVVIVYYLRRGRGRVVVGAVAGMVLLALVQVPIVGLNGMLATRQILDIGAFHQAQFQNEALVRVPLWIAAEFGGHLSQALTLAGDALVAIVGAAFLAGMLYVRRRQPPEDTRRITGAAAANRELLGYSWALCTMVLVSPITWEHYDSWLLPAFVVCLGLAIRASATGFCDARGHIRREVFVLAAIIVAYVITMHHLPLGYDGTITFDIGPYIGGYPLRPVFMLLRPLAALLAWICSGVLFLRTSLPRVATSQTGPSMRTVAQPSHLSRAVQARVLAALLLAVCATLAVLLAVTTAFSPYQPH